MKQKLSLEEKRRKNNERQKIYSKNISPEQREKRSARQRNRYANLTPEEKEIYKTKMLEWREKNKESLIKNRKEFYKKNKEIFALRCKIYRSKNKEKGLLAAKKWAKNNPEKRKEIANRYSRKSYKDPEKRKKLYKIMYESFKRSKNKDKPVNRLKRRLRSQLSTFVKNKKTSKNKPCEQYLGISFDLFKSYIESNFKKGMTWDNYGYYGWHIDHIIPLSSAKNEEDMIMLFHYTNLQPLWAKENLAKKDKILPVQLKITI